MKLKNLFAAAAVAAGLGLVQQAVNLGLRGGRGGLDCA